MALRELLQGILECAPEYSVTATSCHGASRGSVEGGLGRLGGMALRSRRRQRGLGSSRCEPGAAGELRACPVGEDLLGGALPVYYRRFYLVYLFAGDGSRVYLSLNQGTSEWRSGKMRPINDVRELRARADTARSMFVRLGPSPVFDRAETSIDSECPRWGSGLKRSSECVTTTGQRLRVAYENAAVPTDDVLQAELAEMLPLLGELYGSADFIEPLAAPGTPTQRARGQGRGWTRIADRRGATSDGVANATTRGSVGTSTMFPPHRRTDLRCTKGDSECTWKSKARSAGANRSS